MITYTATNTRTDQFYIGSTTNFKKRQQEHLGSKEPLPFQRSLRKHPEDWVWDFHEDEREDRELEQFLLDLLWGTKGCLNIAPDVNAPTKGRPHTTETKARIGARHKGKKYGPETREKIRQSRLGKSHLKGRKFPGRNSGETNSQSKKVEVTFPSGEKKVFDFGRQAAAEIGCPPSTLHDFARTGTAPSPKGKWAGYNFQYI